MLLRALSAWSKLLGFGRTDPADEERRLWGRISCDVETVCRPAALPERLPARVRNVSRNGISLTLGRAFQPGELLSVSLPGSEEQDVSEVLACVVRCDLTSGVWHLGCTFSTHLGDDEVLRFSAPPALPLPAEQRAWARFPCQARAVVTPLRQGQAQASCPATVLNFSASGIALLAPLAWSVGDLLSIELRRGDGPALLTTLASVVRTTERNGDHLAGCNFIHELPDEQVRLLL
jgi:hypothetical protein